MSDSPSLIRATPWSRLRTAALLLAAVLVGGTTGFIVMGFSPLEAVYQTVTTVSTVGFREVRPFGTSEQIFAIVLILFGVGTALYAFTVLIESFIEGQLSELFGRRRMDRKIAGMKDHVIVCGWGRVGKAIARYVTGGGVDIVVVELDAERVEGLDVPCVVGDATDDDILRSAGIDKARALVAAINTDADNLYVTLSGRSMRPDLFIVARARIDSSDDKLLRAGANRVVNPQAIGGARMAAFVLQPNVTEFLDVVMHDGSLEFRLEEVPVPHDSPLAGLSLRDAHIRDKTGAMVLALMRPGGEFHTNPPPETVIESGHTLIAIGTAAQLGHLERLGRAVAK